MSERDYDDIREAIAQALMLAKVNGSPVHEHLGDLMRSLMEYIRPSLDDLTQEAAAAERERLRTVVRGWHDAAPATHFGGPWSCAHCSHIFGILADPEPDQQDAASVLAYLVDQPRLLAEASDE